MDEKYEGEYGTMPRKYADKSNFSPKSTPSVGSRRRRVSAGPAHMKPADAGRHSASYIRKAQPAARYEQNRGKTRPRHHYDRYHEYINNPEEAGNFYTDAEFDRYSTNELIEEDGYAPHIRQIEEPASRIKSIKERKKSHEILSWVLSISLAIAAAFLIRAFVFEIILVDGSSMYPTLNTDERVAIEKVTRYGGMPERGEIIIVEYPGMDGTYVKRVIGLPGETVEIRDNVVYINGEPMEEAYINPEPYGDMDALLVPDDHVFVMGDNRAHSLDSRASYIGPISHDAIIGHGLFVIWPFDNFRSIIDQ